MLANNFALPKAIVKQPKRGKAAQRTKIYTEAAELSKSETEKKRKSVDDPGGEGSSGSLNPLVLTTAKI
jgi:hypothetical protein